MLSNTPGKDKFILVETGAFFYSVLKSWKYRLRYPIAVIVDSPDVVDQIADKCGVFQTQALSINMPPREFRRSLQAYKDDLCVILYERGRYTSDNMEEVLSLIKSGGYAKVDVDMPVLIAFLKTIPEEYQELFSLVFDVTLQELDELKKEEIDEFREHLRDFILSNTNVLKHEIGRTFIEFDNRDGRFWSAVIETIKTAFEERAENVEKRFCDALRAAYDRAESYEYSRQLPQLFREVFEQSIPEVSRFMAEKDASKLTVQQLKKYIFLDHEFYYLPEEIFVCICDRLRGICTVNELKYALAKAGILSTQGQGRVYMTIKKIFSGGMTARFLWLKREALEAENQEMTFADMYQIRREGGEGGAH